MPARPRERGTGLIATWCGVVVFLALLLFAVQVLYDLWATSVVTAAGAEAVRVVTAAPDDPAGLARAEAQGRARFDEIVGGYARRVTLFDWSGSEDDPDFVHLEVRAVNPRFFPAAFAPSTLPFQQIDRRFRMRKERFR